jgi:peptidoglycan/LPS O-acetylase OafA/YrhL
MGEIRRAQAPQFFVPLESLRGLAALVVILYHAVWSNPITSLRFVQNGALMVDFFFVLSGFVIFHSYGHKLGTGTDVARFLWLRIGRLYPLHLTLLLVFVAFEGMKWLAERHFGIVADKPAFTVNNGPALLSNLLLIHSLGLHHSLTYNYPSWSISTEFYAYVVFAIVRSRLKSETVFATAAVCIVVGCTAILLAAHIVPLVLAGADWGFWRCCAGFFLGTLMCHAYAKLPRLRVWPRIARWVWASPLTLIATISFLALANPDGGWTYALPPLAALIILSMVLWPQPTVQRLLSSAPLRWLGRVSYSLYMVHAALVWIVTQILIVVLHYPKIALVEGHGVATPPLVGSCVLLVYVLAVLALSGLTYRWIEDPLRIRSREVAERWRSRAKQSLSIPG